MRERGTREAARSFYHTCLRAPAHGRKLVCRNLFWMICMFRAECKGKDYEDIEQSVETSKKALKSASKMLDAMNEMLE